MKILLGFLMLWPAWGQTTVWLRSGPPGQFQVTRTAPVEGTVQIATLAPHGLQAGNYVGQWNICGTTTANVTGADLAFIVRSVPDPTHFTIEHLDHTGVFFNAPWCDGSSTTSSGGPQWGGKLTPYTLPPGPKGGPLDGWTGKMTRSITIRPVNGLVSLTVAANVVTAVFSFAPDLRIGDRVGIWGTASPILNDGGKPWTVASVTNGSPNTVVTFTSGTAGAVPAGDYTVNNACGPSGTSNCVSISSKAWFGNTWWEDGTVSANLKYTCNLISSYSGNSDALKACALVMLANPVSQTGLADALDLLRHAERFISNMIAADEGTTNGTPNGFADFGSYVMFDASFIYSVFSDWLSASEKQTFADKILNDIADPGGCTRSLYTAGTGTVTFAGTTITGSGTHFLSTLNVGDIVWGDSAYLQGGALPQFAYIVSSIASDTSMQVERNSWYDSLSVTPSTWHYTPHWSSGRCGLWWVKKHWGGSFLGHPSTYPHDNGGGATPGQPYGIGGSNNQSTEEMGLMAMASALAEVDPRALYMFETEQAYWFDLSLTPMMQYFTGYTESGSYYQHARTGHEPLRAAAHLAGMIPTFPNMDLSGPWASGPVLHFIYGTMPTPADNCDLWVTVFGTEASGELCGGNADVSLMSNPYFNFYPDTPISKTYWDWANVKGKWGAWLHWGFAEREFTMMPANRKTRSDFTRQPTQYLFQASSAPACTAMLSSALCNKVRADAVISRTGWSNVNDTHVQYESRSYFGDHNLPELGNIRVYKQAYLLTRDDQGDPRIQSSSPTLSGTVWHWQGGNPAYEVTSAYITRWGSGRNPTPAYGDASSRYVYAMTDLSTAFARAPNLAQRHFIHLKKAGTEEMVVQIDKYDVSNLGGSVNFHIHYPQNGEGGEGQTVCPGVNGCAGLNTDRVILEQESNANGKVFGLRSAFLSPGTITVQDDGNSYSGGSGHTHRVSVCGGSSCGAAANTLESLIVHRVDQTINLTLQTTAVLSDGGHYVVQADDKIIGMGRGASLVTSYPAHAVASTTTQAIYLDLEPGIYAADLSGTVVASCTVATNDNSCYLELAGGGTLTLQRTSTPSLTVTGTQPSFAWIPGQSVPAPQTVTLACAGTGCVDVAAAGSENWITTVLDTQAAAGTLAIGVDPRGMPPGNYSGTAFVSLPGAANSPAVVPLTLGVFGITTAALPPGFLSAPYAQSLAAVAGVAPYTWTVQSGQLPDGLSLSQSGEITGTPARGGVFAFTVRCATADGNIAESAYRLTVVIPPASTRVKGTGLIGVKVK